MLSSTFNEKTTSLSPSSTTPIKEGTLSYYFNLYNHNEGFLSPCEPAGSKHHIKCTSSNVNFFPSYPQKASNGHTKHGSSSARRQWRPQLDADERGAAPLSWLSALFSRRTKKQSARSQHACDESKCEPFSAATLRWEPPRASSWEQLSSWEKPSSSLWNLFAAEPHGASDADKQELRPAIAAHAAPVFDPLMKKQETSRKGQLQWAKSLLAIKWAIKLRRKLRKKRVAEQGRGDDEDEDRGGTMSAASSSARGSECSQNPLQNGQIKAGQDRAFDSHRELGATWSSHYSYGSLKHNNKLRPRDHGLLRFYLTPTRGIKIGSKRPRSHHPLIPEI